MFEQGSDEYMATPIKDIEEEQKLSLHQNTLGRPSYSDNTAGSKRNALSPRVIRSSKSRYEMNPEVAQPMVSKFDKGSEIFEETTGPTDEHERSRQSGSI